MTKDFGKGWMSKPARDLLRVAVIFGRFDLAAIITAMPKCYIQVRHVEKALTVVRSKS